LSSITIVTDQGAVKSVITESRTVQVVDKPVVITVLGNANTGGAGNSEYREKIAIATDNQVSIQLAGVPITPEKTKLFVNGLKARFNDDYIINSSVITWRSLYPLQTNDYVEIFY
jgi:hypothetical protein